jgi:hypothetical protein
LLINLWRKRDFRITERKKEKKKERANERKKKERKKKKKHSVTLGIFFYSTFRIRKRRAL